MKRGCFPKTFEGTHLEFTWDAAETTRWVFFQLWALLVLRSVR